MAAGRRSSRSRSDPPLCDYAAGFGCLSGSPSCCDFGCPEGFGSPAASQPLLEAFRAKLATVCGNHDDRGLRLDGRSLVSVST